MLAEIGQSSSDLVDIQCDSQSCIPLPWMDLVKCQRIERKDATADD